MADLNKKWKNNVDGSFYVDEQCIACDACVKEAPQFFQMNYDEGHAFVFKQPNTPLQENLCFNALKNCPVEAIGANGT